MKKIHYLFLTLFFLFYCFSCSSTDNTLNNESLSDVVIINEGTDTEVWLYLDGGKLEKDANQIEKLLEKNDIEKVLPKIYVSREDVTSNTWILKNNTAGISKYQIQWPIRKYKISYNDEGVIIFPKAQDYLKNDEMPKIENEENQKNEDLRPTEYTSFDKIIIGPPPIEKYGYDFVGWSEEGSKNTSGHYYSIEKGTSGDKSLVAVWTPKKILLTFDLDNGKFESEVPKEYYVGTDSFTIPNPVKDNYTFVGWYINDDDTIVKGPYNISTQNAENLLFKAIWTADVYSLQYDVEGVIFEEKIAEKIKEDDSTPKALNPSEYTVEDDIFLQQEHKAGYEFIGWILDGDTPENYNAEYHIEKGSFGDKDFVSVWKPLNFSIEYDLDGGKLEEKPDTFTYGADPFSIKIPTKDFYEFVGWIVNDEGTPIKELIIDTSYSSNLKLKAIWKPIDFNISYNLNGGDYDNNEYNPASYNTESESFILKSPNRKGYDFTGWSIEFVKGSYGPEYVLNLSNAGYTFIIEVWNDHANVIYPEFIDQKIIEEILNDFSSIYKEQVKKITVKKSTGLLIFEYPEGYGSYFIDYFASVKNTMDSVVVSNGSFGDRSYKAEWDLKNYSITYDIDGIIYKVDDADNEAVNPISYTINDEFTLINPKRDGYVFKGWILDGESPLEAKEIFQVKKETTGDKHFIAVWEEKEYTINYDLDGGKLPENIVNPSSYTISDHSFILSNPIKDGYKFVGWKKTESNEYPKFLYKINTNICENLSLVAIWRLAEYAITYDLNGGNNNDKNPSSYNIKDTNIKIFNPERTGYKFVGWIEKDSSNTPITDYVINTQTMSSIHLVAVWEPIEYKITYSDDGCFYKYDNVNPTIYTIESEDILIANPYKEGYTFKGWVVAGDKTETIHNKYLIKKGSFGDIKLFAEFEAVRYPIGSITKMQLNVVELGKNDIPRPDWVISLLLDFQDGIHFEKAYANEGDFYSSYDAAVKKAQLQVTNYHGYEVSVVDKNINDTPYVSLSLESKSDIHGTCVVEYWEDATGGVWVLVASEDK